MLINLLDFVLQHLAERRVPWTCVSRDTHIPYETLKKIASGRTPNPGVLHVQKLADYFCAGMLSAQIGPQVPAVNDSAGLVPEGQGGRPAAELTADPKLNAELIRAEQAGLVKLPKQDASLGGAGRRVAKVRGRGRGRAADRDRDISQTG